MAAAATVADPFDAQYHEALRALQAGNTGRARQIYEAILKEDAANPSAHTNLAAMALDEGKMSVVVDHCSVVLNIIPNHPVACEVLAEANLRMADMANQLTQFPQAAAAAEDAATLMPASADIKARAHGILTRFAESAQKAGAGDAAAHYRSRAAALLQG